MAVAGTCTSAPPGPVRCSAGRLGPGLDVRGEGGYIVAPPCVHPSGALYRWHPDRGLAHPVADAPAWFLELLRPRPRPAPVPSFEPPPDLARRVETGPAATWPPSRRQSRARAGTPRRGPLRSRSSAALSSRPRWPSSCWPATSTLVASRRGPSASCGTRSSRPPATPRPMRGYLLRPSRRPRPLPFPPARDAPGHRREESSRDRTQAERPCRTRRALDGERGRPLSPLLRRRSSTSGPSAASCRACVSARWSASIPRRSARWPAARLTERGGVVVALERQS